MQMGNWFGVGEGGHLVVPAEYLGRTLVLGLRDVG